MANPVNAAFRFPPEVLAELDRRRGDLSKTEFLCRLIMSDAEPRSSLEWRVDALERALDDAGISRDH